MTVLVLARGVDPQVDRVVEELTLRGVPVFRTDLVAFPQSLTLEPKALCRSFRWPGGRNGAATALGASNSTHPEHASDG